MPSPYLALVAGMLLIHCVAEDAYHLLRGIVDGLMVDYFPKTPGEDGHGLKVDAAVFMGLLAGSEKPLSRKFKELGIHRMSSLSLVTAFADVLARSFLSTWYNQLFIRCLPWPTALRVIDGLLAEGESLDTRMDLDMYLWKVLDSCSLSLYRSSRYLENESWLSKPKQKS
jgi:hypothetical protein